MLDDVRRSARPGDLVLVKGSRVAGLERMAEALAVKSILVAAAFALAVTLLGTPIAIQAFRVWGWGQRIREDGPHTHMEKMGTPTMGGIVILVGLLGGFLASAVHVPAGHAGRARRCCSRRSGSGSSGSSTTS